MALWEQLVAKYWEGDNASSAVTSSHWKAEDEQYQQSKGADNQTRLTCRGIGPVRWNKPIQARYDRWCRWLHLLQLSRRRPIRALESTLYDLMTRGGLDMTFDVFRHICTLDLLECYRAGEKARRVLLIGDGYGVLGAFLKERNPALQIFFIDLGKTLAIQANVMGLCFPHAKQVLLSEAPDGVEGADFVYCPAERMDLLEPFQFGLAVNVASMQEMAPEVVADYFRFLRGHLVGERYFYCCNRERKILPGGEISDFFEYPWSTDDVFLVDEPCPWHQYFLAPWRAQNGLKILGWRVPWVNFYDGVHRHRLVKMGTVSHKVTKAQKLRT